MTAAPSNGREDIDVRTLQWQREYLQSQARRRGGLCQEQQHLVFPDIEDSFRDETCVLGPHGYRKLADRESVTFSCSKGPSFGDCKDLRIAVSE